MRELDRYVLKAAEVLIYHLEKVSPEDESIKRLYTEKLKPILQEIIAGNVQAPSTVIEGFGYYFLPDARWNNGDIWDRFPNLVEAMSDLSNVLRYSNDEEFRDYCRRCGIQIEKNT